MNPSGPDRLWMSCPKPDCLLGRTGRIADHLRRHPPDPLANMRAEYKCLLSGLPLEVEQCAGDQRQNQDGAHTLRISRRDTLGVLSIAALATTSAAGASDAPRLTTERSQFVELRPRKDVTTVRLDRRDGSGRRLASYRGKAVLVAFWASWCPPCRAELPILAHLQARSRAESFEIAPVSVDVSSDAAVKFMGSLGLESFTTFHDPRGQLRSEPNPVFPLFGMPMAYVVDQDGSVAGYLRGAADWSAPEALDLLRHYGARSMR